MPMNRRQFIRDVAVAGAGFYLGAGLARGQPPQQRRLNILFIMTDQHKLDAMGAYGNRFIQTPAMDALARQSIRFENYYIAAFPCSPSRATLMTGLHPQSHGVVINDVKLDESLPTIATELSRAGYRTCWMGKWHLGGPRIFQRQGPGGLPQLIQMESGWPGENKPQNGFVDWVSPHTDFIAYLRELGLEEPRPGKKVRGGSHTVIENGHNVLPAEHACEAFLTDRAIDYLRQRSQDGQPFFLGVSYPGPHRPMTPPEPWDKMYDPDSLPLPPTVNDPMTTAPRSHREFAWRMYGIDLPKERERLQRQIVYEGEMWDLLDRPAWTHREYRELLAHYYGYISYIDAQIGRLLKALDDVGLSDNTIVVYTTDHGELMGAHGCIFKGMMMYDELMRVPLLVRLPGAMRRVATTKALCSSVDIMPTLLDLVGVAVPANVQGKSFRKVLEGATDDHHDAVFCSFATPGCQMRMIRTADYKYSLNALPRQADELYDMRRDPFETKNLAGTPQVAEIENKVKRRVFLFMRDIQDPWRDYVRQLDELGPLTAIRFDFDHERELLYWSFPRGISNVRVEGGRLKGHIDCPGFMVAALDEAVSGDDYPELEIVMAATAGGKAQFYWATEDNRQMSEQMTVRFSIQADGQLHSYRLKLSDHPQWRGKKITQIRLNPVREPPASAVSADFEIDYIGPPRK